MGFQSVFNVNEMVPEACQCGSLLEHWRNFSSQSLPAFCSEINCTHLAEKGACVRRGGGGDLTWYVIPLCTEHDAGIGATLTVVKVAFVEANAAFTCRKRHQEPLPKYWHNH
ncbi:MAG TPA: hypothetical protein VF889_00710 [Bacteroidota bacterium]